MILSAETFTVAAKDMMIAILINLCAHSQLAWLELRLE